MKDNNVLVFPSQNSGDEYNSHKTKNQNNGAKKIVRKRRTTQLGIEENKKQKKAPSSGAVKQRISEKNATRKKIYEIDPAQQIEGIPGIQSLLPDWNSEDTRTRTLKRKNARTNGTSKGQAPETQTQPEEQRPKSRKTKSKKTANALQTSDSHIEQAILGALEEQGKPMTREMLLNAIDLEPHRVEGTLLRMLEKSNIFITRKGKYALPEHLGYLKGKLLTTSKGYGFLLPDDASPDIFIPQNALSGAFHTDRVVVRLKESYGASREGEIVGITERAHENIVGLLQKDGPLFTLIPDSSKMGSFVAIKKGKLNGAQEGQKVVCKIDYSTEEPTASVVEILGFPNDEGTDILAILRAHNVEEEFPKNIANAVRNIPQSIMPDDIARREDLRNLVTVTIDGADSKDFDDAVSCEQLDNGNSLLGVHIADVSHYVREGSALDKEAFKRATSIYFTNNVIPMLPHELSNGICSLNPNEDRLTLSFFMEIDGKGVVVSHRITESVIHSNQRLVYEDVTALLQGDKDLRRKYRAVTPMLENMQKLAALLRSQRERRGSIDFDIPEAYIMVDDAGRPVNVDVHERGISNHMIEEFMLICNETVAEHMAYLERPMIYRVHEVPERDKVEELNVFLGGFGLSLRGVKNELRPKSLQSVLNKAKDKPEESIISRVVLRSLKKARYCEKNLGHFGLAAKFYCHFTSPIRRYPDLMVHRIIKEMLHGELTDIRQETLQEKLPAIALQSSERERMAMEIEREVDDLKKCEYMAQFIGSTFDGVISGVTNFGLFVELPNTCEGMISLADMKDDYYTYEEKNYRIMGRHTNKVYRLGDTVNIRVKGADLTTRRVDFELVPVMEPSGRRPRRLRSGKKVAQTKKENGII